MVYLWWAFQGLSPTWHALEPHLEKLNLVKSLCNPLPRTSPWFPRAYMGNNPVYATALHYAHKIILGGMSGPAPLLEFGADRDRFSYPGRRVECKSPVTPHDPPAATCFVSSLSLSSMGTFKAGILGRWKQAHWEGRVGSPTSRSSLSRPSCSISFSSASHSSSSLPSPRLGDSVWDLLGDILMHHDLRHQVVHLFDVHALVSLLHGLCSIWHGLEHFSVDGGIFQSFPLELSAGEGAMNLDQLLAIALLLRVSAWMDHAGISVEK